MKKGGKKRGFRRREQVHSFGFGKKGETLLGFQNGGGGKEIFEIKKTKNSRKSIFPLKFKGDRYFFSKLKCWNMDIF